MGGILSSVFDFLGELFHILVVVVVILFALFVVGIILCIFVGLPAVAFVRSLEKTKGLYGGAAEVTAQGGTQNVDLALRASKQRAKEERRADQRAAVSFGTTVLEPETALLK